MGSFIGSSLLACLLFSFLTLVLASTLDSVAHCSGQKTTLPLFQAWGAFVLHRQRWGLLRVFIDALVKLTALFPAESFYQERVSQVMKCTCCVNS